jgi:eukaryotic-like serine/threonine-protein kinase
MDDKDRCRRCGEKRPLDAPSGLCPACLLKAGLLAEGSQLPDVTITFGPASSSVLAAFGEAFGNIPPVLLRDAESITEPGPVIRPSSTEIPDVADRSARLQLFGEIARGGMGAVLKGRDSDLGRDLAVKILLESHRDKPDMIRRFIEEAQIAGQLQHPGIVPIYELGAFGDRRPYFAMKLVKGHTLAEILAKRKSPGDDLPRLLSIFESVCQTMAYAHARGVIHRDLKPSNVMVGSFGEVQVMDWGLAKVLPRGGAVEDASAGHTKDQGTIIATARSGSDSELSQAGSVMGTPSYMAPEQARGEGDQVDERADVFALGSIFCELLTGEPAFTGRSSGEIQRKAGRGELTNAVARLRQCAEGHDPALISLAKSCLAPERDDRPRNAGEVSERMSLYHSQVQDRLRRSEIARAEEKARAEEATKRALVERDRLRLTVALAASVLGLIVLVGGGWAYLAQQRAARRAATERIVNEALDQASLLRGQARAAPVGDLSKWSEALAAANEARSSLEAGEQTISLQSRVVEALTTLRADQADAARRAAELSKDQKLFDRLEAIRIEYVDKEDLNKTGSAYSAAFREFGVDVDQLEPSEAGRLFKQRSNPQEFASRLDDWTLIRKAGTDEKDGQSWKRLILAAQATDLDPWRNSLRSLIGNQDHEAARRLASDEKELARQPARSLYLLAQVLESTRSGNYHEQFLKESIEILKRAWRQSPNDYQICRNLGVASNSELDRVRFSTASVAAKPNSPHPRRGLAEALLPIDALSSGGMSSIITLAKGREVIEESPEMKSWEIPRLSFKSKEGYTIYMGPSAMFDPKAVIAESLSEAVAELRFATRLAPEDAYFHISLAQALVLQGKYDDAISESQLVARINPKYSQGRELACTLYHKGELDLAIQVIRRDIERDPQGEHDHELLGMIYHEQGKKKLAFAAYREAFLRVAGLNNLVKIGLEATGKTGEVIAVHREAIKVHPESVKLHDDLATMLKAEGKTEESNAEFDKVISLLREQHRSKQDVWSHHRLGMAYLHRSQGREAIAQFRRVIELDPKEPTACNEIAWELATNISRQCRDGDLAVEFATKACELTEWKDPVYLDTLGAAYAESGDWDGAAKWQTKAIDLLSDEKVKADYRSRLKLYQEKKPYHQHAPQQ